MTNGDEAGEMSSRRPGVHQQRVQCLSSDADYTSSSEQSCDTVIYVGKNGRMLSDRELTDNEGPPPPPSQTPGPAAVIPSSSAHRPTTSVKPPSVSGVSFSGHSSGGVGFPLTSAASSPVNFVAARTLTSACDVQPCREDLSYLARAADLRHSELAAVTKGVGDSAERSPVDCSAAAAVAKLRKTPASRRGAPPTVDGAKERWIDGPRSAHRFPDVEAASVAAVICNDDGADDDTAETWVDGPAEFQKDPHSLVESLRSPMKLRKSKCAKLYRARAAAVAAATTADEAGREARPARPACDCAESRKDADVSELLGAATAGRQFGVDSCQTRQKDEQTGLATDAVGKTEELGRSRGHHRLSGRKQTNHATLASFYSPDRFPSSAQSSPGRPLRPTGGQTTTKGGVFCGDRTAQWVRSVQVATAAAAAGVAPPPPPMSPFIRPLSPLKSHSVDRVLRGCGGVLLGSIRAWQDDSASDDAFTAVSNNSPPPDYATCVAADLERFRRHSRRLSSPPGNLDINENLQASGASGLTSKLLPVSFTPVHVGGLSTLHSRKVAPVTGMETDDRRTTSSGCEQPEAVFDSSTWPRRQDGGSLGFAAVDVDDELTSSACKRLHHPDGASNPQLSEEFARSDAVDCCKLRPFLHADVGSSSIMLPTAIPTSYPVSTSRHSRHADKADAMKCRNSCHSTVESGEALSPAQSSSCKRSTADQDAINGSNLATSGSNENPVTTMHGGSTTPTPTSPKTAPLTRVKATSSAGKAASHKRSKSPSSGISLLWCIHPRSSKSRVSKSACPDSESSDGADTRRLAGETDSDRGSSLSECPPPTTALEMARRLCSGDDDEESSDYWSARASAVHLPSTSFPVSTFTGSVLQTDGNLMRRHLQWRILY